MAPVTSIAPFNAVLNASVPFLSHNMIRLNRTSTWTPVKEAYRNAVKYTAENSLSNAIIADIEKRNSPPYTTYLDEEDNFSSYAIEVDIGGQMAMLIPDTGSSDLWVMSDYLPKDEQSVHYIYDPHQSQTAKNVHRNWSITYADGSAAKGEVWRDVVEVAGIRSDGQEVEVAISINDRLLGEEFDGILGLGFPNINRCQGGRCTPFFHRIMDQLPLQTFAVNMKEEGEKEGSMDFGWIDSTKFKGELQYTSIDGSNGFWITNTNAAIIGNETVPMGRMVIDTGTTLTMLPSNVVEKYARAVPAIIPPTKSWGYAVDCDAVVPDLEIELGSGADIVRVPFKGEHMILSHKNDKGECLLGLQSMFPWDPFPILGLTFLRGVYAVFDVGNMRIGFAEQAE